MAAKRRKMHKTLQNRKFSTAVDRETRGIRETVGPELPLRPNFPAGT